MASQNLLTAQQEHLSSLLEAVQRCVYFLDASDRRIPWPLTGEKLSLRQKDNDLFEALAAVNERFSKLQDTLGSAMRHALILLGEQADNFLKVLSIYEKFGVVDSVEEWQSARTARNLAAHDYETDYDLVAEHFNALHELRVGLMLTSGRFVLYCAGQLSITPRTTNFSKEFDEILCQLKRLRRDHAFN